jgi:uncharacterized membrane protein
MTAAALRASRRYALLIATAVLFATLALAGPAQAATNSSTGLALAHPATIAATSSKASVNWVWILAGLGGAVVVLVLWWFLGRSMARRQKK